MRQNTCCFTGHRNIPFKELPKLNCRLHEQVEGLIQKGIVNFGCGGALGFDTLAAQVVLTLREKHPGVSLILVLPCRDQTRGWRAADVDRYERIKAMADKVVYTSQEYHRGCMHKRNRHLVDHSGTCICYMTTARGGTAYTVKYAVDSGLNIINLG